MKGMGLGAQDSQAPITFQRGAHVCPFNPRAPATRSQLSTSSLASRTPLRPTLFRRRHIRPTGPRSRALPSLPFPAVAIVCARSLVLLPSCPIEIFEWFASTWGGAHREAYACPCRGRRG